MPTASRRAPLAPNPVGRDTADRHPFNIRQMNVHRPRPAPPVLLAPATRPSRP